MKKVLFVSLICLSSLSFAADSAKLGQTSVESGDSCAAAQTSGCETCIVKNCSGQPQTSDRVTRDAGQGVKKGTPAKGTTKQ